MKNYHEFVINGIIPATQEAYKKSGVDIYVRKKESSSLKTFKKVVTAGLSENKPPSLFPTTKVVFVAIIQFFTSTKKDYKTRDVDNMAKTILDILQQNKFYENDSQVRTLLVTKMVNIDEVPQNLGFVYIKILEDGEDIPAIEGLKKGALKLYEDLKENLEPEAIN
ncbi:TPA: hypothetical protein DCZ46_00655 [Candidatus Campbellbacteria bacterium]|nr:MAG: Endodeoxyribonuclease, RusA-like protein [Candidatus Campbellbacteria bacterium GW2011_OD1_34_28]KKP75402.1 MAG: hypothetical protein UR74_C0001G0258 [Candidatus Campbellbacteria bacterium GW2011_GWD2_35_24]KKP76037.1 MAG: hypothetical protein UR75_C0001G0071 [Candidatus Campbellbacteria bacterium GW2011_GWC2_35_28]KKP77226.1 MAG: hypothetical protein UR76_C0001G0071 [Candidatus Campbellbacteria bacterium GW2011_GWC1_35_31]KKP79155.1 MAG: hypothetical protein UR79_C0001G0071 [Candidatus